MSSDPQAKGADDVNLEDSEWIKIFDAKFGEYFFYNKATGEKKEPNLLTKEECRKIAKSQFLSQQMESARKDALDLKAQELVVEIEEKAARMLQAAYRTRKSRKLICDMIAGIYVKRVDPYTGKEFYYNTATRQAQWHKPLVLKGTDLQMPTWVLRVRKARDGTGDQTYYENRDSPWLSTATKPPGLIPCTVCFLQLASERCTECVEYYCLDCTEEAHYKQLIKTQGAAGKHTGSRTRFIPRLANCVVCKHIVASVMCEECSWDVYCAPCFQSVHANNATRSSHEPTEM
jgi:hypothetical protein